MPLNDLLKNKLLIAKHYPGFNEFDMNLWPFWQLEENIKIINKLNDEEKKDRKTQEDDQKSGMGNLNPDSYMKNMNKYKPPKPPKF